MCMNFPARFSADADVEKVRSWILGVGEGGK